ncbi:MAG: pyridoxamine 5'-phosphate oxidase family protein [Clostridia bacterium]|nr:pyridoxamine 5'-phosphate oxidase family protein [Clostridia bacterium]
MFREMRRNAQQLTENECIDILNNSTSGVLAVAGDDNYPYAVPLSFVYDNGKIYFHCALTGHKTDAIERNEKVSFCVISQDKIYPEEFTALYKSVILFGKAHIIKSNDEKHKAITLLAKKYSPHQTNTDEVVAESFDNFHIVRIDIEHMTGKQAKELMNS